VSNFAAVLGANCYIQFSIFVWI